MLSATYYAQNYAGIIGWSLSAADASNNNIANHFSDVYVVHTHLHSLLMITCGCSLHEIHICKTTFIKGECGLLLLYAHAFVIVFYGH